MNVKARHMMEETIAEDEDYTDLDLAMMTDESIFMLYLSKIGNAINSVDEDTYIPDDEQCKWAHSNVSSVVNALLEGFTQ